MEDKIKLFLQYIKKEKEIMMEFDRKNGKDVEAENYKPLSLCVERVRKFIAYRNIRIEEAWYARMNQGNSDREVREKAYEYDAERSSRHSTALESLEGLNIFAERMGLPKFYEGQLLDKKDIKAYRNIPVRKAETDFFLQFVETLSRTPSIKMKEYFEEVGIEKDSKHENAFMRDLQSNVEKVDRQYGIDAPFVDDDADIKFKENNLDDRFNI